MRMFEIITCFTTNSRLYFFFNDTATTEIYTLSLHDALPIFVHLLQGFQELVLGVVGETQLVNKLLLWVVDRDRKSTRLNSSHANISYAVFCLKKKKNKSKYHMIVGTLLNRMTTAPVVSDHNA